MTRVVVVGAGLLGAAVADRLSAAGAEVTILEADRPGAGTSGSSFAWVNAQEKAPAAYFALNLAGVEAHRELARSLGGDWYHPGGDILLGHGEAAARVAERIERHRAIDYDVVELDRAAVAVLEPDLDLDGDGAFAAAHFPSEAWIDPPVLVGWLLRRARSRGARVLGSAEVVELEVRAGRLAAITTRAGDRLSADLFVLAAGTATGRLAGLAGIRLPMAPSPGLLAVTRPAAVAVAHVVHADGLALRPDGGGRLMLASRQVDAALDLAVRDVTTDSPSALELRARTRRLIPGLGDAPLEAARIGVRSVAADGLPVAGFAPGVDNLYLLVSHSGATLAPVLGELAAGELLGEPCAELEPYRLTAARMEVRPSGG